MDPQLSTSSSSPLLKLPLELLDAIFSQVYEPYRAAYSPLCKQLHPVQHRQYWRRLAFHSYEDLAAFCRVAPRVPGLEQNVVELELCMLYEPKMENDRRWRRYFERVEAGSVVDGVDEPEEVDPDFEICPSPLLVSLLNRLAALRTAKLHLTDEAYVKAFLGDDGSNTTCGAQPWLRRLESLDVDIQPNDMPPENEQRQSWVAKLFRLPKLRVLRLAQTVVPTEPPPLPEPIPSLNALESLTIDAGNLYAWTGAPLAQVAPKLVRLELSGAHPDGSVVAVLREAPERLRELVVTPGYTGGPALDLVLPRFAHLRHLSLGRQAFDPTRLVPYLRSLPDLESLVFKVDAHVTDALLDAILVGPRRLSRLRRLTFGHIRARSAVTVDGFISDGPSGLDSLAALGFRLPASCNWVRPAYPPGATEAGLRDAVRCCSALGIVVNGQALEALKYNEQYRVTRQGVILAWASRAEGRWDVARGLVGDTAVEAYRQGLAAARMLERGLGE